MLLKEGIKTIGRHKRRRKKRENARMKENEEGRKRKKKKRQKTEGEKKRNLGQTLDLVTMGLALVVPLHCLVTFDMVFHISES